MGTGSKKVVLMYCTQTNQKIEAWDYELTKKRYGKLVLEHLPGRNSFTDFELLDVLNYYNSYCRYEIAYE